MRISGGKWGGRTIKTPPGDKIRPTQDCVREALFSMLSDRIADAVWADVFAGSGSVGLEALSRGAQKAIWVEKNPLNARLIADNAQTLAGEKAAEVPAPGRGIPHRKMRRPNGRIEPFPIPISSPGSEICVCDAVAWLSGGGRTRNVDVLFADPPYQAARDNGFSEMLKLAAENETVAVGGLFIGEMPADKVPEDIDGWESIRDRLYGKTRLHIWRRTK
jgi:16S rRNA (guanine966-N2)-methyltransferase